MDFSHFSLFSYFLHFQIKFLQSKLDTAMVQMANKREAHNIMSHLDDAPVFGARLSFQLSKQTILNSNTESFTMPNGKSSLYMCACSEWLALQSINPSVKKLNIRLCD